jgi:hypothetical protein
MAEENFVALQLRLAEFLSSENVPLLKGRIEAASTLRDRLQSEIRRHETEAHFQRLPVS